MKLLVLIKNIKSSSCVKIGVVTILMNIFFGSQFVLAQNGCNFKEGDAVTLMASSNNATAPFETRYVLTDPNGIIQFVSTTPSFPNVPAGQFLAYAVNYDASQVTPDLSIGNDINTIGGDCVEISEPLPVGVCDCTNSTGTITFTPSGTHNMSFTQVYVLTDAKGNILQTDVMSPVVGLDDGIYNIYAINYDNARMPTPNIAPGVNIFSVGGECVDISAPLGFVVCNFSAQIAQLCDVNNPNEGTILFVTADNAPSGNWNLEIFNTNTILATGANGDLVEVTGVPIGTTIEVVDAVTNATVAVITNASNATFLMLQDDDGQSGEGGNGLGCQNELACPTSSLFDLIAQGHANGYSAGNPGGIIGSNTLAGPHNGNFNAVIFGNFTSSDGTGDSEGRLAVQNNFTASGNYTIGGGAPTSTGGLHAPQGWDNLVVGGDVNHTSAFAGVRGNILYNTATQLPPFSGGFSGIPGIYRQYTPDVNWAAAESYFETLSTDYNPTNVATNCFNRVLGTITDKGGGSFELDAQNSSAIVVFDLSTTSLPSAPSFDFKNTANAAAILVLYPGTTVTFTGGSISIDGVAATAPYAGAEKDLIEKTLWNFYEATTFNFSSYSILGSVLAPFTTSVSLSGGSINGQTIFGGDVTQSNGFEFHNFCYTGDLSACDCNPPSIADCDGAVIDFTDFTGVGFSPNPGTGQLCSNTFVVEGLSDGNGTLGGTHTSGDFARGSVGTPGVTTGGVYAVDNGGNPALWLQPGGSDLTPGIITTVVCNTSGSTINDLLIGYDLLYYNDQGRANSFNFSYATGPSGSIPGSFTAVSALDFTTPEAADVSPTIQTVPLQTVLNSINLADGQCIYLRWTTDDVSGSGSRDEFGLDNIFVADAAGCYAIGNRVFLDNGGPALSPASPEYNNGQFDSGAGEVGQDGVTVTLYLDPDGDGDLSNAQVVGTDVTSNGGYYIFTNLVPTFGSRRYVVSIDVANFASGGALEGLKSSTPTGNDATTDSDDNGQNFIDPVYGVTTAPINLSGAQPTGETDKEPVVGDGGVSDEKSNLTYDIGFFAEPGAIGNYVWLDENSDGLQDAGEPGIPNVTVVLYGDPDGDGTVQEVARTVTDSKGGYIFTDLPAGDYYVDVADGTDGTGYTLPETDIEQTTPPTNPGADFGNQDHSTTMIPDVGGTGYLVSLTPGEENLTADFGYNYNPDTDVNNGMNTAAIGDRVWIDIDGDGKQDPNEIGVSGVEVTLTGAGTDGIFGTGDDIMAMTTTDDNGYYLFDNLAPGAYTTEVTSSATASHDVLGMGQYMQTGDPDHFGAIEPTNVVGDINNDNKQTKPVVLAPGDVYLNSDYGYQPAGATVGSIGDQVFLDANANGTFEGTEEPIPGVSVVLIKDTNGNGVWDEGEPIIATDVTDEDGMYLFEGLPVNDGDGDVDYLVYVNDTDNVLDGLVNSADPDGGVGTEATGLGNQANMVGGMSSVSLTPGMPNNLNQDFGYTPNGNDFGEGYIGNYVWFDVDGSDSNGQPDAEADGDSGIEGVLMELLDAMGKVFKTTKTDENGFYYFGGLTVDADGEQYQVRVAASNFADGGVLEGFANSYDPNDMITNPDDQGALVTLTTAIPGNLDQDFGYTNGGNTDGTIGNQVWVDTDADGLYEPGNGEMGIADITLDLYLDLNGNGTVDPGEPKIGTTTTDANGMYSFTGLPVDDGMGNPVNYIVDVTDEAGLLGGYWHSMGTPNTDNNSQTDPYAVILSTGSPTDNTADFGYYKDLASVGNYVFVDNNGDGIQDAGDMPLVGVAVTLTITYADGTMTTLVTTTDANGFYEFTGLLADEDHALGAGTGANGEDPTSVNATANKPKFVISVDETQAVFTAFNYVPTPTDAMAANDLNDSDAFMGVVAIPVQGNNNTAANADPTQEDQVAGYDFGVVCALDIALTYTTELINCANMGSDVAEFFFTVTGATLNTTYKWQRSNDGGMTWENITTDLDALDATYTVDDVDQKLEINLSALTGEKLDGYRYRVIATDGCSVTSDEGELQVNSGCDLPVELLDFTATPVDNERVLLKWSTATETNNAYFSVQRSRDGIVNWEEIGRVKGAGNSLETLHYSYWDEAPLTGINYYRLQQFDFDGQFEYHKVVTAEITAGKVRHFKVYPNPTETVLMVELIGNDKLETYQVELYNVIGQRIPAKSQRISPEATQITMDVSDLHAGLYFVRITDARGQVIQTLPINKK